MLLTAAKNCLVLISSVVIYQTYYRKCHTMKRISFSLIKGSSQQIMRFKYRQKSATFHVNHLLW